jgi:hypothetical protein
MEKEKLTKEGAINSGRSQNFLTFLIVFLRLANVMNLARESLEWLFTRKREFGVQPSMGILLCSPPW